jgi:hypothetical protein
MFRLMGTLAMIIIAAPTVIYAKGEIPNLKGTWVANMSAIRTEVPREYGPNPLASCKPAFLQGFGEVCN